MRGEGRRARGLLLGRFYFSKWLTFPVLGHKKVLVSFIHKMLTSFLLFITFLLQKGIKLYLLGRLRIKNDKNLPISDESKYNVWQTVIKQL